MTRARHRIGLLVAALLTIPLPEAHAAEPSSRSRALDEAERLQARYEQLNEQEDYASALPVLERACSILERRLGRKSARLATCVHDLGRLHGDLGRRDAARALYERALAIREQVLGRDHPDVATTLNGLALIHSAKEEFEEAEPLYRRALAITEAALGPDHPDVAIGWHNLAGFYYGQGRYEESESSYRTALEILERSVGPEDRRLATTLNNLSLVYRARGELEEATAAQERALAIRTEVLGPEHLHVAISLANLALVYYEQGLLEQAEEHLGRALSVLERTQGALHENVATTTTILAVVHKDKGEYERAEQLFERAISVLEQTVGPETSSVADALNGLASLYADQGEHDKAERLFLRAMSIHESIYGPDHPRLGDVANNLATLYRTHGEFEEAERLFERARTIAVRALSPEHSKVANIENNLGILYRRWGKHERARSLFERARVKTERALGADHPRVAIVLDNLGWLNYIEARYEEAAPLFERGLAIRTATLAPEHPLVVRSLLHLGSLRVQQGDRGAARDLHRRALDIEEHNLKQALSIAEDGRRLSYVSKLFASTHAALSLHLQVDPDDPAAAELAVTTLLRRKGRVQELVTQSYDMLRKSLPPEHRGLLAELSRARARHAAAALRGPREHPRGAHRQRLETLARKRDELWATLRDSSPRIRALWEPVTLSRIQSVLPDESALVEYARYLPVFDSEGTGGAGEPRYAAYIVFSDRLEWVDLGPAEAIDELVAELRAAILHERVVPRSLYDAVMEPVVARLRPIRTLFIAPGGELDRVPFGALYDGRQHLVERYGLRFLATGRDLLDPRATHRALGDVVLAVANPTGAELPGTEREVELLTELFPHVRTLVHDDATETRLREHARPWMIHIGTHGFHASDARRDLGVLQERRLRAQTWYEERLPSGLLDNPMMNSGLRLAPPATDGAGLEEDDGHLTAYEVSGWDLRGTELVVLSACGTALGTMHAGEGVLGLRRAFAMAGAQTLVTSLWELDDQVTPDVMALYYRKLAEGVGRGAAMQQAQLELLRGGGHSVRDWAAFVVVGDWRPLTGTPLVTTADPAPSRTRGPTCRATVSADRPSPLLLLLLLPIVVRRRACRPRAPEGEPPRPTPARRSAR